MPKKATIAAMFFLAAAAFSGCGELGGDAFEAGGRAVFINGGGNVKTLDPALADDLASRNLAGAFYDTLLEYDYMARPYRLKPGMLESMPEVSPDGKIWKFILRNDLYFASRVGFECLDLRRVTSDDVKFSFLRLLDSRTNSSVSWILRGKLLGEAEFKGKCMAAMPGDYSMYNAPFAGFKVIDGRKFEIHLAAADHQFQWLLALPNLGVVSQKQFIARGGNIADDPAGSGAFILEKWQRNFKVVMRRNPDYRADFFPQAANPADRSRKLPLADRIVLPLVKQPMTGWLLFLQGKFDVFALEKDLENALSGGNLTPELAARGVKLISQPEFEIRYIGFNFADSLLGKNENLRRAMSLAYGPERWRQYYNGRLLTVNAPLLPGVGGYDEAFHNPWTSFNLKLAREYMEKAGFPGGIDPATGDALTLTLDMSGNTLAHRQTGELFAAQMAPLGIKIVSVLNSRPRFIDKLRRGQIRLFRYSWVGDYPDAENFLQLFYSRNAGGSNRTGFADPAYDRLFEDAVKTADRMEREKKYAALSRHAALKTPWIYEGVPLSFVLVQSWLENYQAHDFPFCRWKYLSVNAEKRQTAKELKR